MPSLNSKGSLEVLMVIGSLDVGGAERHVAQIAPELVRRGWDVAVYCLTEPGVLGTRLREEGLDVQASPWRRADLIAGSIVMRSLHLATSAAWLCLYMLRRRPQIVHFFLPAAYLAGGICAWVTNRPIRIMSRRSLNNYQQRRPVLAKLERYFHKQMAAIVGNAEAVLTQLRAEEHIPWDRLGLIYNGVEPAAMEPGRSREDTRRLLGIPQEALVILIVANLIPYKGHRDLVEGLAGISHRLPSPWRLVCVGRDNGVGDELEALAERLGIAGNVLWLGLRDDVPELVHAADIGVSSSHEEGFSNAVLEGMVAGLAMVATDVGGNAEAVAHGSNGLIVPPRDPEALAAAILTLGLDAELRARYGAEGRRRVVEEFSLSHCVDQYESLYRGLTVGKTVNQALRQAHMSPKLSRSTS
jgi:glycosyltransferase involved in cell wall biosynthesis